MGGVMGGVIAPAASPAPAKLTLSLRVVSARDDGYHEIDAIVAAVDPPSDFVRIEPGPAGTGITVAVEGPAAGGVPADGTNLAARAAEVVLGSRADLHITLHKEIPAGAGLGGGSADAAVVLRLLRDQGADPARVAEVAAKLGSDIPVCIAGGIARMRGRGEIVEPLTVTEPLDVVIAAPRFACATEAVYTAWDALGGPHELRPVRAPSALRALVADLVNDLEPAALAVQPGLAGVIRAVTRACDRPALLAGSGSACFAVVDSEAAAADALAVLQADAAVARAWTARIPATA